MSPGDNGSECAGDRQVAPVPFEPDQVRFVLVEPQSGGNIGAAARAIKNFGFRRLVLVAPACDPLGEEARRFAVDASDLLTGARVETDLDAALEGAGTVAGTTGRAGKQRHPHRRLDEAAVELVRLARAGDLAVLFGRETWGLSDLELDRCTHLLYLPSSDAYPSFNLAQSVLLVAYELALTRVGASFGDPWERPAGHSEREAMFAHLEVALKAIGFLHDDTAEGMMRRLRRMLGKARLTPGEVQILRGIARQTLWAAGKAGSNSREDPP